MADDDPSQLANSSPEERALRGGNASGAVVRVGNTVRKRWSPTSAAVFAYVDALRDAGVDAPEPLGKDDRGRQVFEYVPGELALDLPPLDLGELAVVGALVRSIHDASAGYADESVAWDVLLPAPQPPELICHNDLAPWNLIVGERWVFIDWDGSGPSTRLWDLAYSAQAFAGLVHGAHVDESAARLRVFVDGYGADETLRAGLPEAMAERTAAMHLLLERSHASGREPWGSMYAAGHGEHWAGAARFVAENEARWAAALR